MIWYFKNLNRPLFLVKHNCRPFNSLSFSEAKNAPASTFKLNSRARQLGGVGVVISLKIESSVTRKFRETTSINLEIIAALCKSFSTRWPPISLYAIPNVKCFRQDVVSHLDIYVSMFTVKSCDESFGKVKYFLLRFSTYSWFLLLSTDFRFFAFFAEKDSV